MSTLTIRNLEDPLKSRLRMRAAAFNRSMEEEARQILRKALQEPNLPVEDLGARIRARFAALGDIQLPAAPREPVRVPPAPGADTIKAAKATPGAKSKPAVRKATRT